MTLSSETQEILDDFQGFRNFNKDDNPYRIPYEDVYKRLVEKALLKNLGDEDKEEKIEHCLNDPERVSNIGSALGLDSLFEFIEVKDINTKNQAKDSYYSPKQQDFRWHHRHPHHVLRDIEVEAIEIWSEEFRGAVSGYLKKEEMQDEWLDWFCADVLCYREYIETLKQAYAARYGLISSLLMRFGGWAGKISAWVLGTVMFFVKWGIWLMGLFALLEMSDSSSLGVIVAGIVLLLTAVFQVNKWRSRKKIAELVFSMEQTYNVLSTDTFSWEVLWRYMEDSRKLGTVWPGELWRLVELRK